jgi:hypothetical protein
MRWHFETLVDPENCEELAFAVTAQTIPKSDNNLQPVMPMARAAGAGHPEANNSNYDLGELIHLW